MLNWQPVIGIAAGFLSLLGFVPYLVTIYQGKTQPNLATWWIWTIVGIILSTSYYSAGAVYTLWVPICSAIGHLVIAIFALKYGEGGWNRFDRVCVLGTGISLFLWWQFNSPLIALSISIVIDFLGALPTIRKSYHEPKTEDPLTWMIFLAAHTLNLFAIKHWSFALSAYPLYLFTITTTIVVLLLRPKRQVKPISYNQGRRRKLSKNKPLNTGNTRAK